MSRYDYGDPGRDPAYCDALSDGPRPNAVCVDCGEDFFLDPAILGPAHCEPCIEQRERHTDALEAASLLKRMARCILSADLTKVKDVA